MLEGADRRVTQLEELLEVKSEELAIMKEVVAERT